MNSVVRIDRTITPTLLRLGSAIGIALIGIPLMGMGMPV
jgi:hypothetical protein